jgi:hypothetical protein
MLIYPLFMRNYVKMWALGWDFFPNSGGGFPLFAFGTSEEDLMEEFNARNTYTDQFYGGFTTGNFIGPSKIYVLLDKEILVRYFNGVPGTKGDGSQQITGFIFGFSVGVDPTSQAWPMVYESPRKTGWTNVFTGKFHAPMA